MKVWHLLVLLIGGTAAVVTRPDRWIRDKVAHGVVWGATAGSVDSLQRENGALKDRMAQFERLSAEKDTLLSELREAHLLIEGVATELRRFGGGGGEGGEDSVRVVAAADDESPRMSTRELMIQRLEGVRRHLADLEDSSRVRGERLVEMAQANEDLRSTVAEHLRMIASQQELMMSYVERIEELETEVRALAARNEQLVEEKGVLADSLRRLVAHTNAAYYVVGSREELLRSGVLTEEGGVFSRLGRTLTPSRRVTRTVFTRIDKEHDTVLPLPPGRSYRIISQHDPEYVDFLDDSEDGEPQLRIRDPGRFWAASDYLIIVRR